jgi:hypothetical protein
MKNITDVGSLRQNWFSMAYILYHVIYGAVQRASVGVYTSAITQKQTQTQCTLRNFALHFKERINRQ